ncbi:MAG: hypothetical protein K8R64_06220 [Methanosarcinaceae archaeon]|nr:hypothetical protein [Methanosarcinaceae archaeon]
MRINLEPIGIIKKSGKNSEILIYSDFEQVIKNMVSRLGNVPIEGQDVLVVHKNRNADDGHQVQVTKTTMLNRVGNIIKVGKINGHDDSVIDVRLDGGAAHFHES